MTQPRLEDMHPIIQESIRHGGECTYHLGLCIRKGETGERTALELTDSVWDLDPSNPERHLFRVHLATERDNKLTRIGVSYVLWEAQDGEQGAVSDALRLARDLQTTYQLPYTPRVHRNQQPLDRAA